VFSVETVRHLPPAEPRQTKDIGSAAPCGACALRHAAVHSGVDEVEFSKLVAISTKINLGRKQTLFTEGEPAEQLYSILDGAMMVYKLIPDGRRQITGFLFAGDILGLAREGRYARSAEAIIESCLYSYPMRKVEKFVQRYPTMERRLAEVTRQELVEAQEQMLLLGRKTARERVASFLLKMERHSKDRGVYNGEIFIPMSRHIIADYLGLTTETVSRTLSDLKRADMICSGDEQRIRLSDTAALEAIASGLAQ